MERRTEGAARSFRPASMRILGAAWPVLALLLILPGCGAVRSAEESLRRIDILDRVFEPSRFRTPSPPPPAPPAPIITAEALPQAGSLETGSDTGPSPWVDPPAVPEAPPAAAPAAARAVEPAPDRPPPDPAVRRAALLRQYPWLAQFWGALGTAEQGRVSRAMRRAGSPAGEDAERWDRMGLADRVRLVFG
jgi:pyruvate/2-oxoglutarate dehydrogenase complex dihydrolipoamide acyltransferase (E2) component